MANLTIYKDSITNRNEKFEKLCLYTQEEMKSYVKGRLGNHGKVFSSDGYVYHEGTFPVLLCAHMDTVHKEIPKTLVYANGTLSSTQGIGGDDRCGIYMIFKILKKYNCHVVFLEDEEIGCVGAKKFAASWICKKLKEKGDLKYIIEFDRKGNNHAVTYDCDNKEFDEFITKEFFKKEYGTCSDISYIAPELDIAAVNLSCGYYKEHNIEEWVNLAEMETVIVEAMKVLERTKEIETPFKYIRSKNYGYYGRYGYYGYDDYYDDYGYGYNRYDSYADYRAYNASNSFYDKYYENKKNDENNKDKNNTDINTYEFTYKKEGIITTSIITASTLTFAYYKFFTTHKYVCYADIVSSIKK